MSGSLNDLYKNCILCPRSCHADRTQKQTGVCGMTDMLMAARAALHMWEEPCISGSHGSGAVFFSGCNMHCIFCQNQPIANGMAGKTISIPRLSEIFLELQVKGAHNINLVTPDHFIPSIIQALDMARGRGLKLPVIYNGSSYVTTAALKLLEGYIDIWLPDFKYFSKETAAAFAGAPDYPETAKSAIHEMVRQTGEPEFDSDGLMTHGVIVRQLLLPGHVHEAMAVTDYLLDTFDTHIYISLMNQYTPMAAFPAHTELERPVTAREYDRLIEHALTAGLEHGFIQEGHTAAESFIPAFNNEGV